MRPVSGYTASACELTSFSKNGQIFLEKMCQNGAKKLLKRLRRVFDDSQKSYQMRTVSGYTSSACELKRICNFLRNIAKIAQKRLQKSFDNLQKFHQMRTVSGYRASACELTSGLKKWEILLQWRRKCC